MNIFSRFACFTFLVVFLGSCAASKQQAVVTTLNATALKPVGRFYWDENKALHLISSAVHFSVSFTGNECVINPSLSDSNAHGYLQYELDGIYQKRIRIEGNKRVPIVISANGNGKHVLTIYKATEANTGDILINNVSAVNIAAVEADRAPMIEFIGNSITCGAASDPSETPCGKGVYHDQHNAYMAYGPRVGRALHVNYMLSSVSGIGIYRNWNSDGPTMPQVYEKVDFQDGNNRLWDFKTYSPVIVSIALGTNDMSKGDGIKKRLPFDSSSFVSNYILFVKKVEAKYPEAQIALLSSPMINGEMRELLQRCILAVKENIDAAFPGKKPVATFFFKPMQARGCGGHPNVEDHEILAGELIPFFKGLM